MLNREECRLRLLEENDLTMVLDWRNSDRVRSNMFNNRIITMDEHLAWYSRLQQEKNDVCLIFEWQDNPVGVMNFVDYDLEHHTCHWGFYLGLESLPRGMGAVMGYLGLEYAFEKIGVDCLIGEVLTFNRASISFHNRLGFQNNGMVKKSRGPGLYEEVILFSLPKSDWLAIRSELKGAFCCSG
jgi:UDP-4-amino-4,6-dideoxy-N-acetyl-beta-L-altrosamine N-acetyltransferase